MPARRTKSDSRRGRVPHGPYLRDLHLRRDQVPDFDAYPFSVPAVRRLDHLEFHPKVTFLVGENGSGKSTLLEAVAIACGFNPEGGSRNFGFKTRDSHSVLSEYLLLGRGVTRPEDGYFLRGESFFNVATEVDRIGLHQYYGHKSLHEQSHGESFWSLLYHRFFGRGLYLLDEPETALSPTRQMAMLSRMHQLIGQHSQFVIATHSPIIMAYPDPTILLLDKEGLRPVAYRATEHYAVTHRFLSDPQGMLKILLREPGGK
jgi:predicted ATPase